MSSDTDSDEETLLLLTLLISRQKKRKLWVNDRNKQRKEHGEFHRLFKQLESDEDRFFVYFRMSRNSFDELYKILRSRITKIDTNWRRSIHPKERLAICLRYLITGDSFQNIAFSFRVGPSTVSCIVKDVCKEIWNCLQPAYLPTPTKEIWRESESGYQKLWNFPNCVGSIDGKHIKVKSSPGNRSKFTSILLLAVADPFYKFIVADVGNYGSHNDMGIFENTIFYREYICKKSLLPPKPLPGSTDSVPHVLIGDEGFALKTYLMRPYPKAVILQDEIKQKFNQRICRARSVVVNLFRILTANWQIFLRPIECNLETAIDIVKATCCLHNFVQTKNGYKEITDIETSNSSNLIRLRRSNQRSTTAATQIREDFMRYFNDNN